ncbi:MAG: chemotaxis protein CheX [Myxococcales bacterium]|nr:chemotaxis protein CheX [Myxococcales bacterium]MDD9966215.1 chemotaxis protein CheX [Myxococcales bacterium]
MASTAAANASVVEEFHKLAIDHLQAAAIALFSDYGKDLQVSESTKEEKRRLSLSLGAAIGFTSEHVRGVLAIAVDERLAKDMNPLSTDDSGAENSKANSTDWIGELANQLLGRLKNKLLANGVELALSTPVVVQGTHLRLGAVHRRATRLLFTDAENQAHVWWDAEVDSDLVISESTEEPQSEGEMVLF